MNSKPYFLLFTFLLLAVYGYGQKAIIWGKVVRVADGDTITLLDSLNQQHSIRLHGIDCPEKTQDYYQVAKDFTASLCMQRTVRAEVSSYDQYRRAVAKVYVDSLEVNYALLKSGLAWQYLQFDRSPYYAAAEADARLYKRQIWSIPHPTPPWEFRKVIRQNRVPKAKN